MGARFVAMKIKIDAPFPMIKAMSFIMAGLFSLLAIGSRVAGNGVLYSYHASLRSIAKNNEVLKYCISNEFICAEIGRFIGLPIPPCGIGYAQDHAVKHWFASLNFNLTADDLPPVDPEQCVSVLPDLSTGLILFDIWIANPDRHRKNLSVDLAEKPPHMSIFDHSHALFGNTNGEGARRLNDLKDKLVISDGTVVGQNQQAQGVVISPPYLGILGGTGQNRHCLLDSLKTDDYFSKWYDRISSVPDYLIDDVCGGTVDLDMITALEASTAKAFLIDRRNNVRKLVNSNQSEFSGISQWRLTI
jgi:hypothetical protein